MENALRETADEPVLLSWEMPATGRRLLAGLFWSFLAAFLLVNGGLTYYAADGDPAHERVFALISVPLNLFMLLVFFAFFWPVLKGASGVTCTNSVIRLSMLVTGRRHLRWDELAALRKGRLGHDILQYGEHGRRRAYLFIPPDVREKLIAILREASDARIVGFDSET